jgi:hypothetical protein
MDDDPAVTLGRPRGKKWTRVGYGLYRADEARDLHAWQRTLPPSGRFTHLAGAQVLGWSMPPLPLGLPVMAATNRTESRPQRVGLTVLRTDRPPPCHTIDGLRVDPLPRCC